MVDAKAYLKQVQLYDTHICNKLEELQTLREMTTKITTSLKPDAISGGGFKDKLGDAIVKIIDLQNEINQAIDKYVEKKREVSAVIEKLENPDQIRILHMRYFEGKTWEQIACDIHMTYRNVCYIHGRALQEVNEITKGAEQCED